jgi:NADH:ubiquinone oxidoreductase subunit
MDHTPRISYISPMNSPASTPPSAGKVTLKRLGGWRALLRNPGLFIATLRGGAHVGEDPAGNNYFQTRKPRAAAPRRWVLYAGAPEASTIGPEWHAWLHYLTAAPLPAAPQRPWQKPHLPNLTGTAASHRPAGHDYNGGKRAAAAADYESWSPDPSSQRPT